MCDEFSLSCENFRFACVAFCERFHVSFIVMSVVYAVICCFLSNGQFWHCRVHPATMANAQNLQEMLKAGGYDMEAPSHELLKALPKNVKKRVCALKKLQLQSMEV